MPVFSKLSRADVPDGLAAPADVPDGPAPADVPVAVELRRELRRRGREPLRYGSQLTPRELEILRAAAEGLSTKEMAHKFSISKTTVKNHFSGIFIRLGANERAHAVAIGIREGYVDVGPSTMPRPDHLTADEITVLRKILALWESTVGR